MLFKDRHDAAIQLIPFLKKYQEDDCIIMAVPRGGIPIGYYLAKHYHFPLELLLAKKVGHPWNPELAIGAASLEDSVIDLRHSIPEPYITNAIKQIRQSLTERFNKFIGNKLVTNVKAKTVIIVDDGIATGNTVLAAIKLIQKRKPKKIVIATPVSPIETAEKLSALVDDFICLHRPHNFVGVGMYYMDFSEVSDSEAIQLLNEYNPIENIQQ